MVHDHSKILGVEAMAISKFKATCLAVLERVRTSGQPVLITRRGVPVARIVPPPKQPAERRGFGSMAGTAEELGDVTAPVGVEDWEATR